MVEPEAQAPGGALVCPDCGEQVVYSSCQQQNSPLVQAIAMEIHRIRSHNATYPREAGHGE